MQLGRLKSAEMIDAIALMTKSFLLRTILDVFDRTVVAYWSRHAGAPSLYLLAQ
jgi:hypothetical protein